MDGFSNTKEESEEGLWNLTNQSNNLQKELKV